MSRDHRRWRPPTTDWRRRLYHGETAFDFVGAGRRWFAARVSSSFSAWWPLGTRAQLRHRLQGRHELGGAGRRISRCRRPSAAVGTTGSKTRPSRRSRARMAPTCGWRRRSRPADQAKVTAALAKLTAPVRQPVAVDSVGPTWGSRSHAEGRGSRWSRSSSSSGCSSRCGSRPRWRWRHRRRDPRHPGDRRHLRHLRLRRHPQHRHRRPDHPRVLALRHRGRVRQGRREHHAVSPRPDA